MSYDYDAGTFTIDGKTYPEGTEISLDGTSGKVYMGILDSEESE